MFIANISARLYQHRPLSDLFPTWLQFKRWQIKCTCPVVCSNASWSSAEANMWLQLHSISAEWQREWFVRSNSAWPSDKTVNPEWPLMDVELTNWKSLCTKAWAKWHVMQLQNPGNLVVVEVTCFSKTMKTSEDYFLWCFPQLVEHSKLQARLQADMRRIKSWN